MKGDKSAYYILVINAYILIQVVLPRSIMMSSCFAIETNYTNGYTQLYQQYNLGWKQLPRIVVYLLHSDMSVYYIIPNQCRLRLTPLYTTWSMSIRLCVDTCDILLTLPGSCLARSIRSGWIVWVIPSMALLASFVASSNFFSVSAVVLRLTCVSSIKLLILFSSFRVLMI